MDRCQVVDFDDGPAEFDAPVTDSTAQAAVEEAAEGAPVTVIETVEAVEPAEAVEQPTGSAIEALTAQEEAGNAVTVLQQHCDAAACYLYDHVVQ